MPTPASPEELERQYCDPRTGSIKRRWLFRQLAGIRPVGPIRIVEPSPPEPTRADIAARQRHDADVARAHAVIVTAELAAIDRHVEFLKRQLDGRDRSYAQQELRAELAELAELRRDIAADTTPIMLDRDGRPLDDRTRDYLRFRTAELRVSLWANAEREAASGDHRQARMKRLDSLRARQIAEQEMHLRRNLRGYIF